MATIVFVRPLEPNICLGKYSPSRKVWRWHMSKGGGFQRGRMWITLSEKDRFKPRDFSRAFSRPVCLGFVFLSWCKQRDAWISKTKSVSSSFNKLYSNGFQVCWVSIFVMGDDGFNRRGVAGGFSLYIFRFRLGGGGGD
jgi:hypothetical protein